MPEKQIVIAPFSNEDKRNWPKEHFQELIALLLAQTDHRIVVLGAAEQAAEIDEIIAPHRNERVSPSAGVLTWAQVQDLLQTSSLVIGNNSGITHLAAKISAPAICIFSASHDPWEWRPRGALADVLFVNVPCALCASRGPPTCPYDKKCLRLISPTDVLRLALEKTGAAQGTSIAGAAA